MKIAIAQLDPVVGAFQSNLEKIRVSYERACAEQARLLLTPELSICGYPPHDLLDRPEMQIRNDQSIAEIAKMTVGKKCAILVGHVSSNLNPTGHISRNTVSVFEDGKQIYMQSKGLLPTYDVFDEARYFEPEHQTKALVLDGKKIGVAICEDLWAQDLVNGRSLYDIDLVKKYKTLEPELLISCSASPYEYGKNSKRAEIHSNLAKAIGVPLLYVNQTGATDEILFDGGSFGMNAHGALEFQAPFFQTHFQIVEWVNDSLKSDSHTKSEADLKVKKVSDTKNASEISTLTQGLVLGIREYFKRTQFKKAIIGLSGGIDSAVVAALTKEAIGSENVIGIAMSSQFSSSHSLEDAEILAKNLQIQLQIEPIKFLFSAAMRQLSERRGTLADIAQENLQSRLRGLIVMTLANHENALVITTGNKSELAMGYCTLYGDMVGALAPIGDLFKTRVYEVAAEINRSFGAPIPERSITKAPSAELKPNQKDQDTLPPYELLDELLEYYVERSYPISKITEIMAPKGAKAGVDPKWIQTTLGRIELNEYKRRQAAPVLKVSSKAFGVGRRIPIAKIWDQK